MNKTVFFIIILICLLSAGCSSDKIMRENFGDKRPHILIDEKDGKKYIVIHRIGDLYQVLPLFE